MTYFRYDDVFMTYFRYDDVVMTYFRYDDVVMAEVDLSIERILRTVTKPQQADLSSNCSTKRSRPSSTNQRDRPTTLDLFNVNRFFASDPHHAGATLHTKNSQQVHSEDWPHYLFHSNEKIAHDDNDVSFFTFI